MYYEVGLRDCLHSKQAEERSASRRKMTGVHPRRARDGWAGPPETSWRLSGPRVLSSMQLISWVQRVGDLEEKGFFKPPSERRRGLKEKGMSRADLSGLRLVPLGCHSCFGSEHRFVSKF